jgi:hypothetical protein
MTRKDGSRIIRIVHPICCGLDVHKECVSACIIFPDSNGDEHYEVKVFNSFTDELISLREWLLEHDCPVVDMDRSQGYVIQCLNIIGPIFLWIPEICMSRRDKFGVSCRVKVPVGRRCSNASL